MKYFTLNLLDKASNMLDPEYKKYDKLWQKNLTEYWEQFNNYKHRLSSRFVKEYCKHGFHDYNIEFITFNKEDKKTKDCFNIELRLSCDNNKYLIRYLRVKKYILNIDILNNEQGNVFLYSEILPIDDMNMSHEILLEGRNTVKIEFEKLTFRRIKT